MKGIFNERPPHPCYTFIWGTNVVLRLKKINWGLNSDLSLIGCIYKLMLLNLTAASGVSAIKNLRVKYMTR